VKIMVGTTTDTEKEKKITEAQIQAALIERLELGGKLIIRLNSGFAMGASGRRIKTAPPGTPDLLVLGQGGQHLFIEVKSPKGKLNSNQVQMHQQLSELGHTVKIVRSMQDVEEVAPL